MSGVVTVGVSAGRLGLLGSLSIVLVSGIHIFGSHLVILKGTSLDAIAITIPDVESTMDAITDALGEIEGPGKGTGDESKE